MRALLWALFALWLAAFAGGFAVYLSAEPSGDGFTNKLNRIGLFMGLQTVAALVAVGSWLGVRHYRGRERAMLFAGYAPPVCSALLWSVVIAFVLFAFATAYLGK